MRITAARSIAVVGVAAVAALGTQYASAAPNAGAGHASQAAATVANLAYQYSASTSGGSGDAVYNIPNPANNGIYYLSFAANFSPTGSAAAPEQYSCSLIKNGTVMRSQSSVTSLSDSGFYVGVNGGNVIKIDHVAQFQMFCGTADGSSWTWGSRALQVNLIRLDGFRGGGTLNPGAPKKHGELTIDGSH